MAEQGRVVCQSCPGPGSQQRVPLPVSRASGNNQSNLGAML